MEKTYSNIYSGLILSNIKELIKKNNIKLEKQEKINYADSIIIKIINDILDINNYIKNENSLLQHKDIIKTLMLYYTALYFDNLELLDLLIKNGYYKIDNTTTIDLFVLDKRLSINFEIDKYIKIVSTYRDIFYYFYKSLCDENLEFFKDNDAIEKFCYIIKEKPNILNELNWKYELKTFLSKYNLSKLDTNLILNTSNKQRIILKIIKNLNEENIDRIINLIKNYNYDVDLVEWHSFLSIFNDEEILKINNDSKADLIRYKIYKLEEKRNRYVEYLSNKDKIKIKKLLNKK